MFRSVFFIAASTLSLTAFATEEDELDLDLEAIHAAPTAKEDGAKKIEASFNALDEEEEFSMDLSVSVPTEAIINPDEELAPEVAPVIQMNDEIEGMNANSPAIELEEIIEEPAAVDPSAKDIEWNLDLSEDMEIGDQKITTEKEKKSDPVNLDFLEE